MSFNKKIASKYALDQRKKGASAMEALLLAEAHMAGFDAAVAMLKVLAKKYRAAAILKIDDKDLGETKIEYWKGFEDGVDEIEKTFNSFDKESYSDEM